MGCVVYDIGALGGYSIVRHEKLIQTVKNRQRVATDTFQNTRERKSRYSWHWNLWTFYHPQVFHSYDDFDEWHDDDDDDDDEHHDHDYGHNEDDDDGHEAQ